MLQNIMLPTQRRRVILEVLEQQTTVRTSYLQNLLGVNSMMLWRDLNLLEDQGLLKRFRGCVMRAEVANELSFDLKVDASKNAKQKIARFVAQTFIQSGDSFAMEGGTTVSALTSFLNVPQLTVLTNSASIIQLLCQEKNSASVICSGGFLRQESGTFVGKQAVTFFSKRRVKTFFMSATGFDLQLGLSDPNPQEIEVKQAMQRCADQVILMIDGSKFGVSSLMQVIHLNKVDIAVFDVPPPIEYANLLGRFRVKVLVAS